MTAIGVRTTWSPAVATTAPVKVPSGPLTRVLAVTGTVASPPAGMVTVVTPGVNSPAGAGLWSGPVADTATVRVTAAAPVLWYAIVFVTGGLSVCGQLCSPKFTLGGEASTGPRR